MSQIFPLANSMESNSNVTLKSRLVKYILIFYRRMLLASNVANYGLFYVYFTAILVYYFVARNKNQFSGGYLADTSLGEALMWNSPGFYSIIVACVVSCIFGVDFLIDVSLDVIVGVEKLFEDSFERTVLALMNLVPLLLLIDVLLGNYEYLPFVFAVIHAIQLPGNTISTLNILHRNYSDIFTYSRLQFLLLALTAAGLFSLIGFGEPVAHWTSILTFICAGFFSTVFMYLLRCVAIRSTLYRSNFMSMSSHDVYTLTYVMSYGAMLLILTITGFVCLTEWTRFNVPACNAFIYANVLYSVPVCSLPGKVSKLRQKELERELAVEQEAARAVELEQRSRDLRIAVERQADAESAARAVEIEQQQREIVKQKETIIRYLSHEIRSPMMVVDSNLLFAIDDLQKLRGILTVPGVVDSAAVSLLQNSLSKLQDALHSCKAASILLSDLLIFEAMSAQKYSIDPAYEKVTDLMPEIIRPLKAFGQEKNISIDFECRIKEEEEELVHLYVDKPKFEQVIRNLITNSVKFTKQNGMIKVVVEFEQDGKVFEHKTDDVQDSTGSRASYRRGRNLLIKVIDNGAGISKENLKRLFAQFVQFDPKELQGGGGTGLGLHISKRIVNMHEGAITVSSEGVGHGTTFTIKLPSYAAIQTPIAGSTIAEEFANMVQEFNDVRDARSSPVGEGVTSTTVINLNMKSVDEFDINRPRKFLVVDDSEFCRKVVTEHIKRILRNENFVNVVVVECDDGDVAIAEIESRDEEFELIFMDNVMKRMGGLEATRKIRQLGYDGKIIGLTGNVMGQDISDFLTAGANEVLGKPVNREQITRVLHVSR